MEDMCYCYFHFVVMHMVCLSGSGSGLWHINLINILVAASSTCALLVGPMQLFSCVLNSCILYT